MGLLSGRNKPSMTGAMSGRQAKGITRGGPSLCQSCVAKPARVSARVNGKAVRLCHDCAEDV